MNLFDLVAKVTLDTKDYDKGVKRAAESGKKLSSSIGAGLKKAGAIGMKAVGLAATAISAVTGFAVKNIAQYEQMVGGVDTLFKESSKKVQSYAENAYKTAGMDANTYMETATGFAASLLQSLQGDTEKAADLTDLAIRDMSDNANKMGTSMESIRYAYQGFAKQNFMMLDNLKLGYGGTKTEMERLLKDAEKLSGVKYKITNYSDIIEAIHVIQSEIGITGTTALEAEETISGSFSSMKAAFKNLITGFGREDADVESLTDTFIQNFKIVAANVSKRIPTIFKSVTKSLKVFVKEGIEDLPNFIKTTLPDLIKSGLEILRGMITGISQNTREIMDAAFMVVDMFLKGLFADIPTIVDAVLDMIPQIIDSLLENTPEIIEDLIYGVVQILKSVIKKLPQILDKVVKGVMGHVVDTYNDRQASSAATAFGLADDGMSVAEVEQYADAYKNEFGEENYDKFLADKVENAIAKKHDESGISSGTFGDERKENKKEMSVTINVQASPGQSTQEIAKEVAYQMQIMAENRRM